MLKVEISFLHRNGKASAHLPTCDWSKDGDFGAIAQRGGQFNHVLVDSYPERLPARKSFLPDTASASEVRDEVGNSMDRCGCLYGLLGAAKLLAKLCKVQKL
jgi:hypothetical protein